MSLIDRTYFIGDINIPQLSQPTVQEKLDIFISRYETKLLRAILGNALYLAFTEGLTHDPIDQKWLDLRDGRYYQDKDGNTFHWDGLANGETKESLIADYVYYHFIRDDAVQMTAIGAAIPKSENAQRVSPSGKMVNAWNRMTKAVWALYYYLETNNNSYFVYEIKYPDETLRADETLIVGEDEGLIAGENEYHNSSLNGYQYTLERRGFGTLIQGIEWDYVEDGGWKLLLPQEQWFYDGDAYTLHFEPHLTEVTPEAGSTYPEWDEHYIPKEFLTTINDFGI